MATVNGWDIRDQRGSCSASTVYDGSVIVSLWYDSGRNSAWLSIANPAWESVQDGVSYPGVRIDFTNDRFYSDTRARGLRIDNPDYRLTGIVMHLRGDEFLADFATSAGMTLKMGEILMANLSLRGTRAAMQRLARCAGESFRRFPPDPFAGVQPQAGNNATAPPRSAQSARSLLDLQSHFSAEDYPAAALRNGEQGTTRFRLTVGANGRVSDCVITTSSGSSSLDLATCRILRSRVRFTPAQDRNGNPTSDIVQESVTWRLPAPSASGDSASVSLPGHPSRIWIQLATVPSQAGLQGELTRLRRRAPRLLDNRVVHSAPYGRSSIRLLIGPFDSSRAAQEFVDELRRREVEAFAWTSEAGQEVRPVLR